MRQHRLRLNDVGSARLRSTVGRFRGCQFVRHVVKQSLLKRDRLLGVDGVQPRRRGLLTDRRELHQITGSLATDHFIGQR